VHVSNVYTYRKPLPYRHQRAALKFMLRHDFGGALLMEPRTGKTRVTIDWLSVLNQQGKIKRALIVCPNRVMMVWLREFFKYSPRRIHVQLWDRKGRRDLGPNFRKVEPPGYDLYVAVVNYDAFATPGRRTPSGNRSRASGRFKLRSNIAKWLGKDGAACVLDESHKIKAPAGKAANMLVNMGEWFDYRAILTGTPLTKAKRTHDVFMQWQFLNPDRFAHLPTAEDFKRHYGIWRSMPSGKGSYDLFLRPKNLKDLQRRMAADSYIIRRDQCFDLPPREDIVEYVELDGTARRVYDEMAEQMVTEIEEGVYAEAGLPITKVLRLAQITSGFVTDDQRTLRRVGYQKFDRLKELLEDLWEKDQKVVVAARWRADLDLIEDFARESKIPTYAVRGKMKREDSDQAIVDFEEADGAALMAVQPAAAALGIDLSSAAHMVWYSHTPSWVDFTQCCDRIALSRRSTTFYHIVAKRTVDEVVLATLAGDGDIARAVMTHPRELINGHPLDLDDHSRLQGIGSFQYKPTHSRGR
jgi:Mesyanzhinovviridae DNA helicase